MTFNKFGQQPSHCGAEKIETNLNNIDDTIVLRSHDFEKNVIIPCY